MKMFQAYCLVGTASEDFQIGVRQRNGNNELWCSFSATKEHEVDAAIMSLLHLRDLLRRNRIPPIPRNRSLVLRPTQGQGNDRE